MSWKNVGKNSYDMRAGKFPHWQPKVPYAVPWEGNKPIYNIGNGLAYALQPVFKTAHTGIPYGHEHQPCGYWWRDYRGPYVGIFTSLLYPVLNVDSMNGYAEMIAGMHKWEPKFSFGPESIVTLDVNFISGMFKTFPKGFFNDSMETISVTYISSRHHEVHKYTGPMESIESTTVTLSAGKHWPIIKYINWPVEAIESTSVSFTGGAHDN